MTKDWSGLLGLDLASEVSCSKPYKWNSLKTWNKKKGYIKNKKKKYRIVAIDYGIKKIFYGVFLIYIVKYKLYLLKLQAKKF